MFCFYSTSITPKKVGMSVCQCIVYIGGFVGSQRQKLVESQNRFTTDIFLFKNPCMIFEVSTGSYTPLMCASV